MEFSHVYLNWTLSNGGPILFIGEYGESDEGFHQCSQ